MVRAAALVPALVLALGAAATPAQAVQCRLALVLALDVSSSVDPDEDRLQRGGVVAALTAPEVVEAFFASDLPVALAVFEWSGRYNQDVLLEWTMIDSRAALLGAAETVAASTRGQNEFPTALGYALGFGARMLAHGPACLHKTIDMAGDGQSNDGFPPASAYRAYPFQGVTVNGLVINGADFEGEIGLIAFYQAEVLHGPGAFLEIANGFEDYERAMRRKLERELAPPAIGALPGSAEDAG